MYASKFIRPCISTEFLTMEGTVCSERLILTGRMFKHNTYNMHLNSVFGTQIYIFYNHML